METQTQQKKVIPFIHGKGKSGKAITGDERVLIKDTFHYPNAFTQFLQICSNLEKMYLEKYGEDEKPCFKSQMLNLLNKQESHIQGFILPNGEEVIFLNLDAFKGKDFNYLNSIVAEGQKIYLS
jgi:hypothetical protein